MRYFISLTMLICLSSCKKDSGNDTPPPPAPLKYKAFFDIKKPCLGVLQDTIQFIDSNFQFTNRSAWSFPLPANPDTLNKVITYKWDFGDNTNSNTEHASHAYALPGDYRVSLYTFINNVPSDTFYANVRAIIGQREIKTAYTYTTAIDIAPASANSLLLLISAFNSYSDPPAYSLVKLDSLLKPVWTVNIPGNSLRLNSISRLSNSDYILSGNFTNGNTGQFSITRITSQGTLVWTKYITNLSGNNVHTIQTQDGGFITIGDTTNPINPFPVTVKCNSNGDEVWRKSYNSGPGLRSPDNIIETSTGYLFGAYKPGGLFGKVVLTAIDFNGNIAQQQETNANNAGTIFRVGIVKNGNGYLAYATNSVSGYLFNDNLSFNSSQTIGQTGVNHATAHNGSFYVAEGNHQYSFINKLTAAGMQSWSSLVANYIPISCNSVFSGATRYCKKAMISGNDIVAFSYGENSTSGFNSSSVYVEKFRQNDGQIR
jgi:hypothetical protein